MRPNRAARAVLVIVCVIASTFAGCSKPIDSGSSVPSVYQPLLFVAGAVGVGIFLTSYNHKGNTNSGGGGTPQPTPTTPSFVVSFPSLVHPFDISLDFSTAGSGGIGAIGASSSGYGFSEIGSAGPDNGTYALPTGYKPVALAIDGSGNDWFVDATGLVDKCPAATSVPTTCVPTVTFADGLGSSGTRSITADGGRFFVAQDNLAGTVSWAAYALNGTGKVTGSYTYTGSSMYNVDAAVATIGAIGVYTIFHKNGASWKVAVPTAAKNTYAFSPAPVASANMASDGLGNNYGLLGSAGSGSYEIGHYVSPGNSSAAPGVLVSSVVIAYNGVSNVALPFQPPVFALHTDGLFVSMLDANGTLVLFAAF